MVVAAHPVLTHVTTAPVAGVHQGSNPAPNGWVSYVVRPGDSTYAIAATYNTSVAVLVAANHLPNGGRSLHIGQTLTVPRTAAQAAAHAAAKAAAARAAAPRTYVVRSGDTPSDIATRHGLPLAKLLKLNAMSTRTVIYPGQRLRLPGTVGSAQAAAKSAAKATGATTRHTVKPGDTLGALAERYDTSVSALRAANGLKSTVIYPGQKLVVPGRTSSAAPAKKPTTKPSSPASSGALTRTEVKAMIIATARRHGVDPKLALAIAWQESGWQHNVLSSAHAIGIMQVIPDAGDWASSMIGRTLDLRKPQDNVTAGVVILRALQRMAVDQDQAIAAYYQGLGSVRSRGVYADTRQYVRNVKALMKRM